MDHGLELPALQPREQLGRRNDIGELALGEVMPFALGAQHIADHDVEAPGIVQRRDNIGPDKTGSTGHQ